MYQLYQSLKHMFKATHAAHPGAARDRDRIIPRAHAARGSHRRAFTLVEMLVSTALVVIMMAMFATIFQLAAGAIGTQRGIATNDQRARTLVTILRNDLKGRSFRNLIPYHPGETDPGNDGPLDFDNRRGYFYISENDIYNDADDVLQFTVDFTEGGELIFGNAFPLGDVTQMDANQNQPEWDDGQDTNGIGTSNAAEVSYFVRNGNLYRRVLLLRSPLDEMAVTQPTDDALGMAPPDDEFFYPMYAGTLAYPTDYNSGNGFDPAAVTFWNDFDYSAHFDATAGVRFHHSTLALDNDPLGGSSEFPLGIPANRFGHDHATGQPHEFFDDPGADLTFGAGMDDVANSLFFGRFTHEETSHPFFQYPAGASNDGTNQINDDGSGSGNPMALGATINRLTLSDSVAVGVGPDDQLGTADDASFAGGARRAEDVLLTNVHSFDVKIWDDGAGDFVDIGNVDFEFGFFNIRENRQPDYGPKGTAGNGPDGQPGRTGTGTDADDDDSSGTADDVWGPGGDGQPGLAGIDDDGINGIDDAGELGWKGSDDTTEVGFPGSDDVVNRVFDTWHPQFDFDGFGVDDDGDTVVDDVDEADEPPYHITRASEFPAAIFGPDGMPGEIGFDDDGNGTTDVDLGADMVPGFPGDDDGNLVADFYPGADGQPGVAGVDDDGVNGIDDAGELGWVGSDDFIDAEELLWPGSDDTPDLNEYAYPLTDDYIGIRAIRITIRYHDRKSDQLRQLTIEQALVNDLQPDN